MTWKQIPSYPDYEASDSGEGIRRIKNKYVMKGQKQEYIIHKLTFNGKRTSSIGEHILIAETFLPKLQSDVKLQVNHKDGNKFNNLLSNLEWMTQSQNIIHKNESDSSQYDKVAQYDKNMNLIKEYWNFSDASREMGINRHTIANACKSGKLSKGFYWKRIKNENKTNAYISVIVDQDPSEVWKDITNTSYMVSSIGRVRSKYGTILSAKKPIDDSYARVHIDKAHVDKTQIDKLPTSYVHKLVAKAFIKKPDNWNKDFKVNHKDGNKTNNRIENLEWCTQSENLIHAADTGLLDVRKSVIIIDKDGKELKTFKSISDASREYGIGASDIGNVCRGKAITAGGYYWKFKGDDNFTIKKDKTKTAIRVLDTDRKELGIFGSVKEAKEFTGEDVSSYFKIQTNKNKFEYIYEYVDKDNIRKVKKAKKVYQFDLKGKLLKEFESAAVANEKTGASYSGILECCNPKNSTQTCKDFLWSYEPTIQVSKKLSTTGSTKKNAKPIAKYDLEDNLIEIFSSQADCARKLGLNPTTVNKYVTGTRNQPFKDYVLKYYVFEE